MATNLAQYSPTDPLAHHTNLPQYSPTDPLAHHMQAGHHSGNALTDRMNERMQKVREISDSIARASEQIDTVTEKLGWTREYLMQQKQRSESDNSTATCMLDSRHTNIKLSNLVAHLNVCCARKAGMMSFTKKDILPSPMYCYEPYKQVVPVILGQEQYSKLGIHLENIGNLKSLTQIQEINTSLDDSALLQNSVSMLHERDLSIDNREDLTAPKDTTLHATDPDINTYKPTDRLDKLRFIYSWCAVPSDYLYINLRDKQMDSSRLKSWLVENLPAPTENLALEADVQLVTLIYEWLNNPTLSYPDGIHNCLHGIFGNESRLFVLRLWKFIWATLLCKEELIPEVTRKEFEFYSLTMEIVSDKRKRGSSQESDIELAKQRVSSSGDSRSYDPIVDLPSEWILTNVPAEKRLALYEHVTGVGKLFSPATESCEAVVSDVQAQSKVLDDEHENSAHKSQSEILAALRDDKRRRQTYRGRNQAAAQKKMSRIAVIREQVEQHMAYLDVQYRNDHPELFTHEIKPSKPTISVRGRSRSPHSRTESPHHQVVERTESGSEGDCGHSKTGRSRRLSSSKGGERREQHGGKSRKKRRSRDRSRDRDRS